MTALYVDIFEEELYVFSDGRCTNGYMIQCDNTDKVFRLHDGNIMAIAGTLGLVDSALELYNTNSVNLENVSSLPGEGTVLFIDKEFIHEIDFDNRPGDKDKDDYNIITKFKHKNLPVYGGSGGQGVMIAQLALDAKNSKNKKAYVAAISQAFDVNASIDTSCSGLYKYLTIKIK